MSKTEKTKAELQAEIDELRLRISELEGTQQVDETDEMDRNFLDSINVGLLILNKDLEILALNKKMREWFPDVDPAANPICYHVLKHTSHNDICSDCPVLQTFADGNVHEAIIDVPTKDETIHYRVISSPIMSEEGEVIGAMEVAEDITKRRKIELALQKSEEKYRKLVENLNDVIFACDTSGNLTYISPAIERVRGFRPKELLGKPYADLLHHEERARYETCLKRCLDGSEQLHEFHGLKKDGSLIDIRVSAQPAFEGGEVIGITAIETDISEHKQVEKITRQTEELSKLYSIVSILAQNLPLKEKLTRVFERLALLLGQDIGGIIYLKNPDDNMLHTYVTYKTPPELYEKMKIIPVEGTFSGQALKTNKPVIVNDISIKPSIFSEELKTRPYKAFIAIPMKSENRDIGVLVMAYKTTGKKFAVADINLLQIICQQIAQTVENHRFITAMLESESSYQEIFANVTDVIMIADVNGRIKTVNPSTIHMLGYSEGELSQRMWSELIAEDVKEDLLQLVNLGKGVKNWQVTFVTKDHREIPVEMHVTPIRRGSRLVGQMIVVRDIRQRLKLLQETTRAQKMASLSLLVSGIAHEFNNILGTIHTWTTFTAKSEYKTESVEEMFKVVNKQTLRGRNIVQDLLLFSGNYQPALHAIRLNSLIDGIINELHDEFQSNNIDVRTFYQYQGLIEGDPHQLEILFKNLIHNSIHALSGREEKKIIIRLTAHKRTIKISIFDNGCGMEGQTAEHIFEPFFSTKKKGERGRGIGVGLAICYGIVENHGGYITVKSQPNVSTIFFITLNKKSKQQTEFD